MKLQKRRFFKKKADKLKYKKYKLENLALKKNLKHRENEIKVLYSLYKKTKQKNKQNLEYITDLAHEIKTPLTAIWGFSKLMTEQELSKTKQNKFLRNILSASKHTLKIVEDTLEKAKTEAIKAQPDYEYFLPALIIKEILSILNEQTKPKNIKITTSFVQNGIIADKRLFKQLIYNLVDNAIKFNKTNGSIDIKTKISQDYFIFEISDTGYGILKEEQHKIFEMFSCVNANIPNRVNSTGIGLSLCKRIIKLHNRDIGFNSKDKEGSCFWFSIPIEPFNTFEIGD